MGADLLLTAVIHKTGKKLDWTAGREAIKRMPLEDVRAAIIETDGDDYGVSLRKRANEILSDFKRELLNDQARDAYEWILPGGYTIHIRGGTSWGEDPSEGWTAFANMHQFPKVLKAIGVRV